MNRWLNWWREQDFGIRPGELHRVQTFFLFFVGIGMFYTAGVTVGDTLFLSNLPPEQIPFTLPWVYVGIAVAGFLAVLVFDFVQNRSARHRVIIGTQLVLAASVLGLRFAVDLDAGWLYFLLMVWLEVSALLSITVFFSFAGDYFSTRDARRLYPFIVGGMAVGTIIAGYAVSVAVIFVGTRNLLYGCGGLLLLNAGLSWVIHRRSTPLPLELEAGDKGESASLAAIFKRPYVRLIALMMALSLVMSVIVDFQMKWVAGTKNEQDLARFFGAFYGWIGVAQLLFQFLVVPQLLRRLGIINSLIIFPLVIGLFSAVLLGAAGFGYFGLGLLAFSAAANFARITLAETLDLPSRELLFLPLPTRIRVRAQPFMNGALASAVRGLAGVLLLALVYLEVGVDRLSFLAVVAALLIIALLLRLRQEYRETLALTLRSAEGDGVDLYHLSQRSAGEPVLEEMLLSKDPEVVKFTLRLMRDRPARGLLRALETLLDSEDPSVIVEVLGCLGKDAASLLDRIRSLLGNERSEVREAAILALGRVGGSAVRSELSELLSSGSTGTEDAAILALAATEKESEEVPAEALSAIEGLFGSESEENRVRAARLIGAIGRTENRKLIRELILDSALEVRIAAAEAAGYTADAALVPELLDSLKDIGVRPAALRALAAMPRTCVPVLEARARKKTMPATDRRALIQAIASIGGPRAVAPLWERAGMLKKDLVTAASATKALSVLKSRQGLHRSSLGGFRKRTRELSRLIALFNRGVEEIGELDPFVCRILKDHAKTGVEQLLSMFALKGHARQIDRVLFNLFQDALSMRARALDLLDDVLPRKWALEVSSLLRPLLDDRSFAVGGLADHTGEALMECEPWIRSVVAFHLLSRRGDRRALKRLTPEERRILEQLDTVASLKEVPLFARVAAHQLIDQVDSVEWISVRPGEVLFEQGDEGDACFVIAEGEAEVLVDGRPIARVGPLECIGEMAPLEQAPRSATVRMQTDCRLMRMSVEQFRGLLTAEPGVARALLNTLDQRIRKTQGKRHSSDVNRETATPVAHIGAVPRMTTPDLQQIIPVVTFLVRVALFKSLPLMSLTKIAGIVQEVSFSKGEVLFEQGDVGDALYLVAKGSVEVIVDGKKIAELEKNAYIGEMALVGQQSRSATVKVAENAKLLRIWSEDFSQLLTTEPEVSLALLRALSARLRKVSRG